MEKKIYTLKNLKQARKAAGMSQEELSKRLDVHLKTVRNWEQGLAVPEFNTLMLLCDLLSCDIDYLAGRIETRTHDINTICELTGLTPAAAEKLQEYKKSLIKYTMRSLSDMIKTESFVKLVVTLDEMINIANITGSKPEQQKTIFSYYDITTTGKVELTAQDAVYTFLNKANVILSDICREMIRNEQKEKRKISN